LNNKIHDPTPAAAIVDTRRALRTHIQALRKPPLEASRIKEERRGAIRDISEQEY